MDLGSISNPLTDVNSSSRCYFYLEPFLQFSRDWYTVAIQTSGCGFALILLQTQGAMDAPAFAPSGLVLVASIVAVLTVMALGSLLHLNYRRPKGSPPIVNMGIPVIGNPLRFIQERGPLNVMWDGYNKWVFMVEGLWYGLGERDGCFDTPGCVALTEFNSLIYLVASLLACSSDMALSLRFLWDTNGWHFSSGQSSMLHFSRTRTMLCPRMRCMVLWSLYLEMGLFMMPH